MIVRILLVAAAMLLTVAGAAQSMDEGPQTATVERLVKASFAAAQASGLVDHLDESGKVQCQAKPGAPCYRFFTSHHAPVEGGRSFRVSTGVGYEIHEAPDGLTLYAFTRSGAVPVFQNNRWLAPGPWTALAAEHLTDTLAELKQNYPMALASTKEKAAMIGAEFAAALAKPIRAP